jgi:Domain of unknown function (DUF4337)
MAEVEIHAGHEHSNDEFGRRVGVMVGIIGIVLAAVTILSHRAHTQAIIERTDANDQWSYYQAKKMRQHLADVGSGLAKALATDPSRVQDLVAKLDKDEEKYAHESEDLQKKAEDKVSASEHEETRAVWLDIGEGFLELGMVLSSLYFLSKNRLFPIIGGVAAVAGTVFGILGIMGLSGLGLG